MGPGGGLVGRMCTSRWARGVYLLLRPGRANAVIFQLVLCHSLSRQSHPVSSWITWNPCPGPPMAPITHVLTRQRRPEDKW